MKKFSVIVPVYNVEKYLHECVDSIINQTCRDIEIILIDDGSPDMSGKICDEYAEKDKRIRVIHKENGGQGIARNVGLSISEGEYIVFVDSDDKLAYDDALSDIYKIVNENNKPDIILKKYNIWNYLDDIGTGQQIMHKLLKKSHFNCAIWDKVYRRDFIIDNKYYFIEGFFHEDIFWSSIVLYNAKNCVLADMDFYDHRLNSNSTIRNMDENSVLRRAVSKLNVTNACVLYFSREALDDEFKKDIYEYLIGQYMAGIFEGMGLKKRESKKKLAENIKKTDGILKYLKDTERYKPFLIPCKIMGMSFIVLYYKLRALRQN